MRTAFLLLLLAVASWCCMGSAHAQTPDQAATSCGSLAQTLGSNHSRYTNVSGCIDYGPLTPPGITGFPCAHTAPNTVGPGHICISWHDNVAGVDSYADSAYDLPTCAIGYYYDKIAHQCEPGCSLRPTETTWNGLEGNATYCQGGCTYTESFLGGGTPTGASCPDNSPPCPVGTVKIAAGDFLGACAPDRDGDGVSDGNDPYPDDPTNGQDGSKPPPPLPPPPPNCGTAGNPPCPGQPPGDQTDDQASGGGTCQSAPSCSGDGIECAILFQNWKGRCASEAAAKSAADAATAVGNVASATTGVGVKVDGTTAAVNGLGGKLDAITNAINNKPVGTGGEQSSCGSGDESCAGGAGAGNGDYASEGDGKTFASIATNFQTQMRAAPILHATDTFFAVPSGGACPAWTVPETAYWSAMTFDQMCSGPLADMLQKGGYLLLAVYAYAAFKIAVY